MKDSLKPCPFCGCEAEIGHRRSKYNGWNPEGYIPRCKDKSCIGRLAKIYPCESMAIKEWNKRFKP